MASLPPNVPPRLLIDSNLLVLFLVGSVDPRQIEQFKRPRQYTPEDFKLLCSFAAGFNSLVTTPNILTEASNLTGQLAGPLRGRVFAALATLTRAPTSVERYFPSADVVEELAFLSLGLTDAAILLAATEPAAVLTDDLDLYLRLAAENPHVYNFNHLRSGSWGLG